MRKNFKFLMLFAFVLFANIANSQQFLGGGTGTADDPYKIYTAAQWDEFAEEYFLNDGDRYGDFSNIHIRLMNDLIGEEKITKILCCSTVFEYSFNGFIHGGGHKIDISDFDFYRFNEPTNEYIISEGCLFNKIGVEGVIDSLEIVGTSKNFISIVNINYGKLHNLICNIIPEPTQDIWNSFFLEYALIMAV